MDGLRFHHEISLINHLAIEFSLPNVAAINYFNGNDVHHSKASSGTEV